MQPLVISILGKDKPGIIDTLAKKVYQCNGNWQGSSFAHMAGMFTGFVEVLLPGENHQQLIDLLDNIDDLEVRSVSATTSQPQCVNYLSVDIMGNDKTGIVQELTDVLRKFNINIQSFDSRCESAPNWGSLMFKARAIIATPDGFDDSELKAALEALSNDLVIDINATH